MPRPDAAERLKTAAPKQGPSKSLIAGIIAVVLVITGGAAFLMTRGSTSAAALPTGAIAEGNGVVMYPDVTLKSGAKTVDVYEDFQCPICNEFEQANGEQMKAMAKAGEVKVIVHMMSFLDDSHPESNNSSKRAANAAFCAAAQGKFADFHTTVYANQPTTEGAGYTDAQLKSFGKTVGISGSALDSFNNCVTNQNYKDYVAATETRAGKNGVTGTPTFFFAGTQMDNSHHSDQWQTLLATPNSFESVLNSFKG